MKHLRLFALALAFAVLPVHGAESADAAIRRVLAMQVEAWNRANVAAFMKGYSEDCTFISKTILHGSAQVAARYRKAYPSPDAMGKLGFADLAVRQLDENVAIVTGHWHLDRSAGGGGPAGGIFSLVFQKFHDGWRIVLDHTA